MKVHSLVILLVSWFLIPAPHNVWASKSGPYELSACSYKNNTKAVILKLNKNNGKSWILNNKSWEAIAEKTALPSSVYKIMIMPLGQGWFAVRIDTLSGKTWKLKKGIWVEYQ